jgi:hypothetical protein
MHGSVNRGALTAVGVLAAVLALSACSAPAEDAAPQATVTVTATPQATVTAEPSTTAEPTGSVEPSEAESSPEATAESTMSAADFALSARGDLRFAHDRWLAGAQVLIRCQSGMNRSGLFTSMLLVMAGLTPGQAITRIRQQRGPGCLFNEHFVTWLVEHATTVTAGPEQQARWVA